MHPESVQEPTSVTGRDGLQRLIDLLAAEDYQVIGPRFDGAAVALGLIARLEDLPIGIADEPEAGRYRTTGANDGSHFAFWLPAQGWKRYIYPPTELLLRVHREGNGFAVETDPEAAAPKYALLGVRACDLTGIRTLDRAIGATGAGDVRYSARRDASVVIAVNCTRCAATCFCASMGSGPRAGAGHDIAMTELDADDGSPMFVLAAGSRRGATLISQIADRPATEADLAAEAAAVENARTTQVRSMVPDVETLLRRNLEHRAWSQVAERCLGCANCTMVCPTCFCATVEDTTDLSGEIAERWRKWDSCFTIDFSYIHGGSIRRSGAARYRQWMTHKLSSWWQQFETSGCVGCGRCIVWCPVGIDITEETRNLRESEGGS
jgi:sulfhydrogenase subunit beta (sulfur reductase)